ncbi:TPA: bifunctional aspartate kinase/homoserine dehydrogenase I [Legionella feeleii]
MLKNIARPVHKFGGSSLANAERFKVIPQLLTEGNELIVVSALQGVTSQLQQALDEAIHGQHKQTLQQLMKQHETLIQALQLDGQCLKMIQDDLGHIHEILQAITRAGFYEKNIQQLLLGYGELWSAHLLSAYLSNIFNRKVICLDASKVLFVYEKDGMLNIHWEKSEAALLKYLESAIFDQLVITGFIAADLAGKRTTLGRNGSDFSAAIFANLFNAPSLTIWTDVDGVYSADPKLVKAAFVINNLSYQEALELAYFGSKVLHPMTIAPAAAKKIPITIKNSFRPSAQGTYISNAAKPSSYLIKGISCLTDIALINIEGTGILSVSGMTARVCDQLNRHDIRVIFIAQASSEHSLCLAIPKLKAAKTLELLSEYLHPERTRQHIANLSVDEEVALLAVVGDNMVGTPGIASRLCTALSNINVSIRAMTQGASERNISLLVKNADVYHAIQAIHTGFYLSNKTLSIGLIGPGNVGKNLLNQLHQALPVLLREHHIQIEVRAILNSQKMLLLDEPIPLDEWQIHFQKQVVPANMDDFIKHMANSFAPNIAIIDCTANQEIAMQYTAIMEKGIHLITPNKHANAGDYQYYQTLKKLSQHQAHYFYEATVCAGLPVISTLQDLIKTGDTVKSIIGVVSGTLSYIFNEMSKGRIFSEVVLEAQRLGFTEPDPREDLSGMDVARKLICLARELGHSVALQDVKVQDLVPPALKACSLEQFLSELPQYDYLLEERLSKARIDNQCLHYVGTVHQDGRLTIDMQFFESTHPFARLEGTDNMIIFKTERYDVRPMIIQGPGAGAAVTAAGIFSDLLRLVSVL